MLEEKGSRVQDQILLQLEVQGRLLGVLRTTPEILLMQF